MRGWSLVLSKDRDKEPLGDNECLDPRTKGHGVKNGEA